MLVEIVKTTKQQSYDLVGLMKSEFTELSKLTTKSTISEIRDIVNKIYSKHRLTKDSYIVTYYVSTAVINLVLPRNSYSEKLLDRIPSVIGGHKYATEVIFQIPNKSAELALIKLKDEIDDIVDSSIRLEAFRVFHNSVKITIALNRNSDFFEVLINFDNNLIEVTYNTTTRKYPIREKDSIFTILKFLSTVYNKNLFSK